MKIKQETRGKAKILFLEGKLDVHSTPAVLELLETLVRDDQLDIVLDLSRVRFVSSYGLGALVTTNKGIHEKGGRLKLAAMRPEVKVPFEITGLLPQFEFFDSVDAAVGGN